MNRDTVRQIADLLVRAAQCTSPMERQAVTNEVARLRAEVARTAENEAISAAESIFAGILQFAKGVI